MRRLSHVWEGIYEWYVIVYIQCGFTYITLKYTGTTGKGSTLRTFEAVYIGRNTLHMMCVVYAW